MSRVRFEYTNYRGVHATRLVTPVSIRFGATEHHPEPQWLLEAICHDREAERTFALAQVENWRPADQEDEAP